MKKLKTILILVLLLALVGGFAACGGTPPVIDGGDDIDEEFPDEFHIEALSLEDELEDFYIINASYPQIKGFPGSDDLSKTIEESIYSSIQYIFDDVEEYKADGEVPYLGSSFYSDFGYFENENLVSLWVSSDLYMGGAHGMYWIDTYTFNSQNGTLYKFLDLFAHECSVVHILDTIFDDLESNADYYFDNAAETVWAYDYDFRYYIDGDILTIYFPLYDIAPYASGIISYDFTCYELEEGLEPEIFKAMRGQEPTENLFNYD